MDVLAINQKSNDNDNTQGPSLTSQNRDERILARRTRIEQRLVQRHR